MGHFKNIDEYQITDLRNITMNIQETHFICKNHVISNPTFGKASRLVGGADGDLIIDQKMIEIKTVKSMSKWKEYLRQLLAYYALLEDGGVDDIPFNVNIDTLSIYFARHGEMCDFPLASIFNTNREKDNFLKWFARRINNH